MHVPINWLLGRSLPLGFGQRTCQTPVSTSPSLALPSTAPKAVINIATFAGLTCSRPWEISLMEIIAFDYFSNSFSPLPLSLFLVFLQIFRI